MEEFPEMVQTFPSTMDRNPSTRQKLVVGFYMVIWYFSRQGRFKQGLWSRNVCQLEFTFEDYFDKILSQELWLHKVVVKHIGLQNYIV